MSKDIILKMFFIGNNRTFMLKFVLKKVIKTHTSISYGPFPYIVFRKGNMKIMTLTCVMLMDHIVFYKEIIENSRQ